MRAVVSSAACGVAAHRTVGLERLGGAGALGGTVLLARLCPMRARRGRQQPRLFQPFVPQPCLEYGAFRKLRRGPVLLHVIVGVIYGGLLLQGF